MSNFLCSQYTNSTTPALSAVTGIVVGQLGVPFPPVVGSPGVRRGMLIFENRGSGSVYVTPLGPNLQNASQFVTSSQGFEIPAGLTPLSRLEVFNSDDRWAALSATGSGDNLLILESS